MGTPTTTMTVDPPEVQYNAKGQRICGAKRTNGNGPCQVPIIGTNGRCRIHGGFQRKGVDSPTFKHGGYSSCLPDRLAAQYLAKINDPELLSLEKDVILAETRVEELLGRLSTGETNELWLSMSGGIEDLRSSLMNGKTVEAKEKAEALQGLIERATEDRTIWGDVSQWMENKRRLAESEMKRRVALKEMVGSQQLLVLMGALLFILNEEVKDRDVLKKVSGRIRALMPDSTIDQDMKLPGQTR